MKTAVEFDPNDPQVQKMILFTLLARSSVRRRVMRLMRAEIRKVKEIQCQPK